MASFPTTIVSPTDPASSDKLSSPSHSQQHQSHNAEIVAVETKIGTGSSTPTSGKVLRSTGTGVSSWGSIDVTTDVTSFSSANLRTLLSDETGTGVAVFGTSPTIATPAITRPQITTSIDDANGNEVIKTPATASAVNELTVTNAAVNTSPSMTATGGDTNINLLADGKGTGMFVPRMATPQGYLVNGKITTSVATNNLTVAIKTIQGNDPSTVDPVYARIGNTVRTITSALSVTKNAGTNWCASGGTKFATLEIDYFVYLGYNATDGVVVGFSRIPYARVYSDFSATTTAETYAAISTITTAAATDEYEVVGRFNAVLSATASFNWSIPATSIIISRPIFNTRILSFVPTFVNLSGGALTFGKYQITDKDLAYRIKYTLAGAGIGGAVTFTPPFTINADYTGTDNEAPSSTVILKDTGTGIYEGVLSFASTTTISINTFNVGSTYSTQAGISSTVPFTWANTDVVYVTASQDMP